jgi:hypothetical protein
MPVGDELVVTFAGVSPEISRGDIYGLQLIARTSKTHEEPERSGPNDSISNQPTSTGRVGGWRESLQRPFDLARA